MSYALATFRRILQGDWQPLYFPLALDEQLVWYRYLSEVPDHAIKQLYVRFNRSANEPPTVESWQAHLLEKHRMPTFVAKKHAFQLPQDISGDILLSQALQYFALSQEAIREWYHWQDKGTNLHLEAFAEFPLETLSSAERRYHFYQCLLTEQLASAQQQMLTYVHQTASRKQTRKYIQDHQRALLTYADIIKQLLGDASSEDLPSGTYTLPDVYYTILRSLVNVADFMKQHFAAYLDTTLPTIHVHPIYTDKQQQQYETLQATFQKAGIDPVLLTILDGALTLENQTVLSDQSVSPHYSQQLLIALYASVEKEAVDQEALIRLLIQQNFNVPTFITWCTARLQEELTSTQDQNERLQGLYRSRKIYRQLPVDSIISYNPDQPTAQVQLLQWLEEEIAYLNQVGDVAEPITPASPRIKTNLSVPELSLLIRTFFEVEVLPEQIKANVYRHFSQIFDSVEQEEGISVNTLRDQQYRPSRHTIASLKDKVIAMMNFLNQL